jgi:hypothetical protein
MPAVKEKGEDKKINKTWISPIIKYLKDFIKEDFNLHYYGLTAIFLIISIWYNYHVDFVRTVMYMHYGEEIRFLYSFLFYGFPYLTISILYFYTSRQLHLLKSGKYWALFFFAIGILAFDSGFYYHRILSYGGILPYQIQYFVSKCLANLRSILTVLIPLLLIHKYYTKQDTFYGLTFKGVDYKPYIVMLFIMIPLITWASFQPDFLKAYPSISDSYVDEYLGVPSWVTILFFELCYGWDFVATELTFRGFMVIGVAGVLGRGAILPMVATYAFLHFGRPLGETIGSVFGGYILGVVALYSRNIWGGVAIHLGVAWLMELGAFIQKY